MTTDIIPDTASATDDEYRPYKHFESISTAKTHHFYLSDSIGDPEDYIEMIHTIKYAGANDLVYIYLNNGGGQIRTGIQILNAMRVCPARVITVLESEAHSMSSILFLAGDEFIVHENCRMMFHNFSGGLYGKGNEQVSELAATVTWYDNLIRSIYVPFITEAEIERIGKGEDIWMESPEIRERLESMVEVMQEQVDANEVNDAEALREQARQLLAEADQIDPPKTKKKAAKKKVAKKKKPVTIRHDSENQS
jgi:ATP-dependent protease ClpP protease subunit